MACLRLPLILCVCLLSLPGCGPILLRDDAAGTYARASSGRLELHRAIDIRAGRARAYLQDGASVSRVDEFRPHCQLEVNTLRKSPQTVQADSFTVTRIGARIDQVVEATPLRLAALEGFVPDPLAHFGDGELRRMQVYIFYLQSDRQPDVRALSCGGAFDSPGRARRPSLGDIARALGDYASLRLR
ncbi:MAG: hypothetical protein ABR553_08370 [Gammaproteobacteria bacterium]